MLHSFSHQVVERSLISIKHRLQHLKPDLDKVKAVKIMPKPTCKQEVLSLLGFINYLAKFLPKLSEVAQPLRDLTRANAQFIWSRQHDKEFEDMKKLVVQHPVLKYYDISEEVTPQCDASERGLGATLMQKGQPVAFASMQKRYPPLNRDMRRSRRSVSP